jgi:hypothetical protein
MSAQLCSRCAIEEGVHSFNGDALCHSCFASSIGTSVSSVVAMGSATVARIVPTPLPTFQVEEDLRFWGSFFALAGVLAGLALIWAAGTMQNRLITTGWGAAGVDTTLLFLGVVAVVLGMFMRSVLRAGAEVITLLRGFKR